MNPKIIFAIIGIMAISLAGAALAQFTSITVTPTNYDLNVINGGDTRFQDIQVKSTNDDPVEVMPTNIQTYEGTCADNGVWQDDVDMVISYCDAGGGNCKPEGAKFIVPAFGTLPLKIRHETNIAACPGHYNMENRIEFIEQELPLATGFGYFHNGVGGYQTPKGSIRIFTKLNSNELRIELDNVHDGFESRRCTITSDRMTFFSRRIVCQSDEVGRLTIFMLPQARRMTVAFGSKIYFRGVLV